MKDRKLYNGTTSRCNSRTLICDYDVLSLMCNFQVGEVS